MSFLYDLVEVDSSRAGQSSDEKVPEKTVESIVHKNEEHEDLKVGFNREN